MTVRSGEPDLRGQEELPFLWWQVSYVDCGNMTDPFDKTHWIVHLKLVNITVSGLYLN